MDTIKIKKLTETAILPTKAYKHDAGWDIYADISESMFIEPGHQLSIPTSIAVEMPDGYECQIRSRSGMTKSDGVSVAGGIGTVDCNYRGPLGVTLLNTGKYRYEIKPKTRIAQMVFHKLPEVELIEVNELSRSDRGEKGFGSSGK